MLGFVCLYVIVAKMLLQEPWMRGYDWDDEIQDEIANKIGAWFEQLKSLHEVTNPQCLRSPEPVESKHLSMPLNKLMVQQSISAADTVTIFVTSRLHAAKSKVASLNPMTVPGLELKGTIMGLRLTQSLLAP